MVVFENQSSEKVLICDEECKPITNDPVLYIFHPGDPDDWPERMQSIYFRLCEKDIPLKSVLSVKAAAQFDGREYRVRFDDALVRKLCASGG